MPWFSFTSQVAMILSSLLFRSLQVFVPRFASRQARATKCSQSEKLWYRTDFPCRNAQSKTGINNSNSRALRRDVDHSFLVSMRTFTEFFLTLVSCCLVSTPEGTSSQIFHLIIERNRNQNFKTIKCHSLLSPLD